MEPETRARVAGSSTHTGDCTSAPGALLHFHPPAPQSPKPGSRLPSHSIHPTFVPMAPHGGPCVCVCTWMHACSHVLVTGLGRAADCHPGAMPGFLQSTLLPSFVLMNGEPPYQSLCLQSRVDPWSPTAGLLALSLSPACFLSTHTNQTKVQNYAQTTLHVHSTSPVTVD